MVPKITKVILNMGLGSNASDKKILQVEATMKDLKVRQDTLRENERTVILAEKRMKSLDSMLGDIENRTKQVAASEEKVRQTQQALVGLELSINRIDRIKVVSSLLKISFGIFKKLLSNFPIRTFGFSTKLVTSSNNLSSFSI